MTTALLVLAQNTQAAPDDGLGIGLIIGAILLALLIFAGIFTVFAKRSKKSLGGVEPGPDEQQAKGSPPVESVRR